MSSHRVDEKSKKKKIERLCYHYMKALNYGLDSKIFAIYPYVQDKVIPFTGTSIGTILQGKYEVEVRLHNKTSMNILTQERENVYLFTEYDYCKLRNKMLSSAIKKLLEFGAQDIYNYNNNLMYTEEFIIYLCDLLQDQLNKKVGGTLSFSFREYKGDSSYEGVIWNDAKFVSSTVYLNEKPLIYFIEFLEEDSDVEKLKKEMIHATAKKLLRWSRESELFYEACTESN